MDLQLRFRAGKAKELLAGSHKTGIELRTIGGSNKGLYTIEKRKA